MLQTTVMQIELIGSRQQFDELEDNWTALYRQDPSAHVFMSWRWLNQLYVRRAEPVCILAVRSGSGRNDYMAFLPLRKRLFIDREHCRFVMSYALAGNDWADQTGLLCAPDIEHQVIVTLIDALAQMHWRTLCFSDMSMTENRYNELITQFARLDYLVDARYPTDNDGKTRLDVAPCITLPASWEHYLDSLSANTRQRLRRFQRSLDNSEDLEIAFSIKTKHEQNLAWFVRFWKKRWLASKRARTDLLAQKYHAILQQGLEDNNLVLLVMYQSDVPVAMIACYPDEIRKTVSFFVAARDIEFDSMPSGLLLHSYMIQWAIANDYHRYHLLRGDEPYKYSLGGLDEPVHTIRIRRPDTIEKTHFLPINCRSDALRQLDEYFARLDRRQTHELYAQLLESWPDDAQTLTHYKNWLNHVGDNHHANCIEDDLRGADTDHDVPVCACADFQTLGLRTEQN